MPDIKAQIRIVGLEQLDAALQQVSEKVKGPIMREGLEAAGAIILAAARENIHSRTGRTADDLRMEIKVEPARDAGIAAIGGASRAYILRWLEFGVKPHPEPSKKTVRRRRQAANVAKAAKAVGKAGTMPARIIMASRDVLFGSVVKHPGIRAQAPLTRALADNTEQALQVFGDVFGVGVMEAAKAAPKPS
jgi:Bacteriophage HK97-gp10, putative tail-component